MMENVNFNWVTDRITFIKTLIIDGFTERIQVIRLFEFSEFEFERQSTLDAIKKGNFLTFLLFIMVLVLLIIIDKKYGFQSKRGQLKKSSSNGDVGSSGSISGRSNHNSGINSNGVRRIKSRNRRSIGSSSDFKLHIPDIAQLQNKRSQRDNLHIQHQLENDNHNKKKLLSQSSSNLQSQLLSQHQQSVHSSPKKDKISVNNIGNNDNISGSNESLTRLLLDQSNDGSITSSTNDGGSISSSTNGNSSIGIGNSNGGISLSDAEDHMNQHHHDSDGLFYGNRSPTSNFYTHEESRRLLNQGIREKAKDKQRTTILNSQLLEDIQKDKKSSQPPQFKRIRSSKKNSYSYQSSTLFNSSTITHSKLNGGSPISNPIITTTSVSSPIISQPLSSFNSNNININNNNLVVPFFNAKIDTTNYIPTQTFGYNYKGNNNNDTTTITPTIKINHTNNNNNNNNNLVVPTSPNHHLVDIVEHKLPQSPSPTPTHSTINSNMLLSVDEFLEKKMKEQQIINNSVVVLNHDKNSLIPSPSLGFKNIRISDHGEKVSLSPPTKQSLKPPKKNRSKLLMSNYNEDGLLSQEDSSSTPASTPSTLPPPPNISLRFASKGIQVEQQKQHLTDDSDDQLHDQDEQETDDEGGDYDQNDQDAQTDEEDQDEKIEQLYKEKSSTSSDQLNNLVNTTTTTTTTTSTIPITEEIKKTNDQFQFSFDSIKTSSNGGFGGEEEDYCDSDIDGEDFSSVNIDYNERFQEIMEDLRNVDCNSLQSDKIKVNSQFIALTQDFVYASSTFGKVIISERYLPNSEKTIPSIDIGGLAGGDKFIVHGILFKFAIDREDFYGSDYAAMCVGGHELKGLINVFNCNVNHLSLPLMALVDYRGFRVIAMSILPVEKDSIYYGSNDYGLTIHNDDEFLSGKVKQVATLLNIKSHRCGEQGAFLHSPADLEGHRGFDGRYYILDFARLYPPEAPRKDIKMGHLYRLLRPEFVRNYKKPLCSDSFSRFIRGHNEAEHNSETLEATSYLLNTTIPELVEELNGVELTTANVYTFPITESLHRSGVNIRYLGYVRQSCKSLDMKSLIFIEMCARVVKQQLRQKLRFKMKLAKIPLEAPYRRLIVAYLNRILGISDKSDLFWNERMKNYLIKKFDKGLFEDEIFGNSLILGLSSFSDHLIDGKYLLFKRIQKMTGLKFTHRINEEFRLQPNSWLLRGFQPLDINDLDEIGSRIKYVPFMNVAQGYLFKVKGEMLFNSGDPIAAKRFFSMALEKLENALETDPNNADTLCTFGEVYSHLGVGDMQGVSEIQFSDRNNPDINKAFEYFQRAIFSNPNHTDSLFRFAQLLERCGEYDSAEDYYLSSLITNPNNIVCLQEYGNFLQTCRNDFVTAEQFFLRGSQNHQYLHNKSLQKTPINIRGSSGLLKVKFSTSSSGNGSSNNVLNFNGNSGSNSGSSSGNSSSNSSTISSSTVSSNNSSNNSCNNNNDSNNVYGYSSSSSSTTSSNNSTGSTFSNNSSNGNHHPFIMPVGIGIGSGSGSGSGNGINLSPLSNSSSPSPLSTSSPFQNIRGSSGSIRLTPPFLGLGVDQLTPIKKSNGSAPNSPRGNSLRGSTGNSSNNSGNNSDGEQLSSPSRKFMIS